MSPRPEEDHHHQAPEVHLHRRVLRSGSRHHPYRAAAAAETKTTDEMGQRHSSSSSSSSSAYAKDRYKHHQFPIAMTHKTLEVRKHMCGDTDVDLLVKEERFPVHKSILAEQSLYFKSMFTAFGERDRSEVELKELIEPDLMAQIIHYLYFKSIHLTPENAQDLLTTSAYLQMEKLQQICVRYMRQRVDRKNCVALLEYALSAGFRDLQRYAEDFILTHFEQLASKSKSEFASLTADQLLKVISSERLLVSSESAVHRAVLQWVSHDPRTRQIHLPRLLEHVHFLLMSPDEVERCRRDKRGFENKVSPPVFAEARLYLEKDPSEKAAYWSDKPKPPRWPKIFVVMRMYKFKHSVLDRPKGRSKRLPKTLPMEYYDFRTRQWSKLAEVRGWRSCSALVAQAGSVYLVGGEEVDPTSPTGSRTVNRVTRYDCESRKWSSAPSMNLARRWAASVVVGNVLYVIGGIGGRGGTYERRLDSVECLDLSAPKPRWKMLSPMSTPRSSHTVEVMDGQIYMVGGGDGKDWLCTSEVYDPAKDTWSLIAPLRTKRWKCGLCVLGGHLYAIGGMDSPNPGFLGSPLRSVERYHPSTDEWSDVAPMFEARIGAAVVAYQGRLYVSGGYGVEEAFLSSTECYDPETDRWTKVAPMRKICGFVGGVLVDRPVHLE